MSAISRLQAVMRDLDESFDVGDDLISSSRNNALTIEGAACEIDIVNYCRSLCAEANINQIGSSKRKPTKSRAVQTAPETYKFTPSWMSQGQRLIEQLYNRVGNSINALYHSPLTRQDAISESSEDNNDEVQENATKADMKCAASDELDRQKKIFYSEKFRQNLESIMDLATKLRDLASYLNTDLDNTPNTDIGKLAVENKCLQTENILQRCSLCINLPDESNVPSTDASVMTLSLNISPTTDLKVSAFTQTDSGIYKYSMEDKCLQTEMESVLLGDHLEGASVDATSSNVVSVLDRKDTGHCSGLSNEVLEKQVMASTMEGYCIQGSSNENRCPNTVSNIEIMEAPDSTVSKISAQCKDFARNVTDGDSKVGSLKSKRDASRGRVVDRYKKILSKIPSRESANPPVSQKCTTVPATNSKAIAKSVTNPKATASSATNSKATASSAINSKATASSATNSRATERSVPNSKVIKRSASNSKITASASSKASAGSETNSKVALGLATNSKGIAENKSRKSCSDVPNPATDHSKENRVEQSKCTQNTCMLSRTRSVCKNFIQKNIITSKFSSKRAGCSNIKQEAAGCSGFDARRQKGKGPGRNRSPCPRRSPSGCRVKKP